MTTLLHTISDAAVVRAVVGMRMKLAIRRHNAHFLRNIAGSASDPERLKHPLDAYLPPRRQWMRPGRAIRRNLTTDEYYGRALFNAVMRTIKGIDVLPDWAKNLKSLIESLRERALAPEKSCLRAPCIRIIPKSGKCEAGKEQEFRVVAEYEDLSDRLLLGFTAKYLTRIIDPLLQDCSHAFRVSPNCSRSMAVKRLSDYLKEHGTQKVYAAECDVKSFFDSVRHDLVRQAFRRSVNELARRGVDVDPGASVLLEQYLEGYDYFTVAAPQARKLLHNNGRGALIGPNLAQLQTLAPSGSHGRIGIPQGGPLSPLLANLLLDPVDKAVIDDGSDGDLLYLRYCDDMILLHTDKSKCEAALKRYMAAIRDLGFVAHAPKQMTRYGSAFFDAKSKRPYRVAETSRSKNASPWVNFLGYQIRHDGQLRVRKESLDRHKGKHHDLVMSVIRLLAKPRVKLNLYNDDIVRTVAYRLVASGVGKIRFSGGSIGATPRCWMSAFDLLVPNPDATSQMRKLDQHRDRLISKLLGALKTFHPNNVDKNRDVKELKYDRQPSVKRPLIGRTLSYCGHLIGDSRVRLCILKKDDRGYGRDY